MRVWWPAVPEKRECSSKSCFGSCFHRSEPSAREKAWESMRTTESVIWMAGMTSSASSTPTGMRSSV